MGGGGTNHHRATSHGPGFWRSETGGHLISACQTPATLGGPKRSKPRIATYLVVGAVEAGGGVRLGPVARDANLLYARGTLRVRQNINGKGKKEKMGQVEKRWRHTLPCPPLDQPGHLIGLPTISQAPCLGFEPTSEEARPGRAVGETPGVGRRRRRTKCLEGTLHAVVIDCR